MVVAASPSVAVNNLSISTRLKKFYVLSTFYWKFVCYHLPPTFVSWFKYSILYSYFLPNHPHFFSVLCQNIKLNGSWPFNGVKFNKIILILNNK